LLAHRAAWAHFYGELPPIHIDHIDGDPTNNTIGNLRSVTIQENGLNKKIPVTNTSGVMGVRFNKSRHTWTAQITHKRKKFHLGYYTSKAEAQAARHAAEVVLGFHKNHGSR